VRILFPISNNAFLELLGLSLLVSCLQRGFRLVRMYYVLLKRLEPKLLVLPVF